MKCVILTHYLHLEKEKRRMKIYDYDGQKNISGKRIKEARKRCGLSQSELAAKLQVEGVTIERDSISRMESGTRFVTDYEIKILSQILNVSVFWLLSME